MLCIGHHFGHLVGMGPGSLGTCSRQLWKQFKRCQLVLQQLWSMYVHVMPFLIYDGTHSIDTEITKKTRFCCSNLSGCQLYFIFETL